MWKVITESARHCGRWSFWLLHTLRQRKIQFQDASLAFLSSRRPCDRRCQDRLWPEDVESHVHFSSSQVVIKLRPAVTLSQTSRRQHWGT